LSIDDGACDSVVRLPYGPFVDALSQLVRAIDSGTLREAIGPGGGELSRLLPHGRLCILPGAHGEYFGEISFPVNERVTRGFVDLVDEFLGAP